MSDKTTISYLRIEPAKNGAVISYDERTEKMNKKNTYDYCPSQQMTEAFETKDGETIDACLDRAMSRFTELWKKSHAGKY